MKPTKYLCFFFFLFYTNLVLTLSLTPAHHKDDKIRNTSIVFATLGRASYTFDIYSLPTRHPPTKSDEFRLTDGHSVNFNGHFPSSSSPSLPSSPPNQTLTTIPPPPHLIYVTERDGLSNIYLDSLYYYSPHNTRKRSTLETPTESTRVQVSLLGKGGVSMKDRPSLVGDYLIYVSTQEDSGVARKSWAAVYSTRIGTELTRRLTPYGVADFSPAVSPSGTWTAVASSGERGWDGEVEELDTDIFMFLTRDGSSRVKIVEHGGWPSWADESTLYFHRRGEDGWWSIYKAIISQEGSINVDSVRTQRVTPPGLHAFTPAASLADKSFIVVATRRPGSEFRHIEIYDVVLNEFREVTRLVSPQAHHFNPFISPDSARVGYHRCRGGSNRRKSGRLLLENIQISTPEISIFRIDGSFPSFSPKGDRIAYVNFPGVYVVNSDGSDRREVFTGVAFTTAWDPKRKGVVYTSVGPTFATESTKVDIISINVDDTNLSYKQLTIGGENNAFPSPSPDGKLVVFRSGRSGHKNLYIMDSIKGEMGELRRLTEGSWTDTMCNWSPNGDWIAFASDRENPGSGSFAIYMVHPNGTGLRKVVHSGARGRTNHPWFSPDGENIVFTSDYAAVSAEPISNPHHYQPYGDIFIVRPDGFGLRRLTHNSYEDGTPTWGPMYISPVDVESQHGAPECSFEDCHWLKIIGVAPLGSTKAQCGK